VLTSTVARILCVIALVSLTSYVTSWDSGYRPTAEEIADIYTAAVRFRLATSPLPARRDLDLFLDHGVVPGLRTRLPEYQVRVHSGGPGSRSAPARWYWLRLGRVTSKQAFVALRGTRAPLKALKLLKRDGKWTVVDDQEMILTYLTKTPNPAIRWPLRVLACCDFHIQPPASLAPASDS
jgi:hypothetical protein